MPRDGSLTLCDVRSTALGIVCEPCGRRGRYRVETLMAEHGDAKLTDLLATLAREAGVRRFVFASSCSVYGYGGDALLDEGAPLAPRSVYAESKLQAERALEIGRAHV